jgi:hypothetical protein
VIAAHTPNWLVLAVIVVFVGLLAGPLGRWLGRPGAEKQEHAARDAAAQTWSPESRSRRSCAASSAISG